MNQVKRDNIVIHNFFGLHREFLDKWETLPSKEMFYQEYLYKMRPYIDGLLYDFEDIRGFSLYDQALTLDWNAYRTRVLSTINPEQMQTYMEGVVRDLSKKYAFKGKHDVIMFGAFEMMDGYARYHHGEHSLYLGLDEAFVDTKARDILVTHEFGHLMREPLPAVWKAWGLSHSQDHDEMVKTFPTVEHLYSEGLSCLISEIENPGQHPARYTYQTEDSYDFIRKHSKGISHAIHAIVLNGHYRTLYRNEGFPDDSPRYAHYVWAWQWLRDLHFKKGYSIEKLIEMPSTEVAEEATRFVMQI